MSFSFYVALPEPPTLAYLHELVSDPAWVCDDEPESGLLDEGHYCHAYVPRASTRAVELAFERGALQARIMTCSSRADHELALALVRAVARARATTVEAEDAEAPMTLAELADAYGPDWIAAQVAAGPRYLIATAATQTIEMSGARRPFHVGPRFLGELRARGPESALADRLLEAFRALQYADDDDAYYAANILRVTPRGAPESASFTIAAWAPDVSYLFPAVERFAILTEDGAVEVLHARGPDLAGGAWTWIDEKQALVEAIPSDEWSDFVRRARSLAIS